MSYEEYNDLFVKAQKNKKAPFVCFSLDLVNSKSLSDKQALKQQQDMIQTMKDMVEYIKLCELKTNTKILLNNQNVKINKNIVGGNSVAYYNNPCILSGDFYAFYVYNNTILQKDFINLFLHFAKANNISYDYHFQSAKFETTEYRCGNQKYYLGYCVGYLQHNKNGKIISVSNQFEQDLEK